MASLRTAFMQTYNCGNCGFSFLTSISCLLYSLSNDQCSTDNNILPTRRTQAQTSFQNINRQMKFEKDRSTWFCSNSNPSLLHLDQEQTDLAEQEKEGAFVHSLEIMLSQPHETLELETVLSEQVNLLDIDVTATTSNNQESQTDFSLVADI